MGYEKYETVLGLHYYAIFSHFMAHFETEKVVAFHYWTVGHLRFVHNVIHNWIDYCMGHRKPIKSQKDMLNISMSFYFWVNVGKNKITMIRKPANTKNQDKHS